MDASNLLKPALARGELHCVGATTLDEYRKHVEKDRGARTALPAGLHRRADGRGHDLDPARHQGEVRGAPRRAHHRRLAGVGCDALEPLHRRPVPAGQGHRPDGRGGVSRLRMEVDSKPEELDALDREILQKQIEVEALKKETDAASKDRLELAAGGAGRAGADQSAELTAQWQAEKDKLGAARELKEQLDHARVELEQAKRQGDLAPCGRACLWPDPGPGAPSSPRPRRRRNPTFWSRRPSCQSMSRASSSAGPASRSTRCWRASATSCLRMEEVIGGRVIGQEDAVIAVSNAVRRARSGSERPAPSDRQLPVPGPDGCRQDRADQGAGRVHVRRRAGHGPDRHVRVHGEALGQRA